MSVDKISEELSWGISIHFSPSESMASSVLGPECADMIEDLGNTY